MIVYEIHHVGGPKDGQTMWAMKPYYQLRYGSILYEAKNAHDYVKWVNDDTRRIELHHQPDPG